MNSIRAILFDADGVVQLTPPDWIEQVAKLCNQPNRADDFVQAVFAAEQPSLTGEADFCEDLAGVLERWDAPCSLDDALRTWTLIEPDLEVLQLIKQCRSQGFIACLATNQQNYRATYMSEELDYASHFDYLFYSCDLGAKKPSHNYFSLICDHLNLPADQMLFIDDHLANVEAAQQAGLAAFQFHLSQGVATLKSSLESQGVILQL